jgi:hypothetical protein
VETLALQAINEKKTAKPYIKLIFVKITEMSCIFIQNIAKYQSDGKENNTN